MAEIIAFGEPLMGFYQLKKEGAPLFHMTMGGDTSNVVLQLAKLGYPAKYVTRIGKDFFGESFLREWKTWNVDCSDVVIDTTHSTGVYFTLFDNGINHRFVYKRENSAAANYTTEDAEKVNIKGAKIFHFSGISQAISKSALESSFYFAERCKSEEITVSYDLNYRELLWSKSFFTSIALHTVRKYADIVTLNLEEADVIGVSGSPEEIVKKILGYGPKVVALKLGQEGCVIGEQMSKIVRRVPPEIKVVDTVGAGDAFDAGVISGIIEGMEIEEIADYANLIAAMVCMSVGSTEGQPTRNALKNSFKFGGDYKKIKR